MYRTLLDVGFEEGWLSRGKNEGDLAVLIFDNSKYHGRLSHRDANRASSEWGCPVRFWGRGESPLSETQRPSV